MHQEQLSICLCCARGRNITAAPFQNPLMLFFGMIYERFYQPPYLPPINELQAQRKPRATAELMAIFARGAAAEHARPSEWKRGLKRARLVSWLAVYVQGSGFGV